MARDMKGRFLPSLRCTPPESREWLIWSEQWRAWHCRSEDGGACGYASSLAGAGLFVRAKAAQYHGHENRAVHITEVRDRIAKDVRTFTHHLVDLVFLQQADDRVQRRDRKQV